MLILHDMFLKNDNSYAMDSLETPTMESKRRDSINEHESFTFETPRISCSPSESTEFIVLNVACCYEEDNLPSLLVAKIFRRMVVDVFVYHKYCKSRSSTMVLTLQLEQ